MADEKPTQFATLAPAGVDFADWFVGVDVSDTTDHADGSDVKISPLVFARHLGSDVTVSSTTVANVAGLQFSSVPAGTYVFEYYLRVQSATATVSAKFAVDFSGTLTAFMASLQWPSAGVTAATGAVDQDAPAVTTGSVWAHQSTRTKGTVLGPQTDVDTTNSDILYRISGLMVVTVAGNLTLANASETATNTTLKAGSTALLFKSN